jgi:hypothetical protein
MMDFRESFFSAIAEPGSDIGEIFVDFSHKMLETQLPGDEKAELRKKMIPNYTIGMISQLF